VAPFERRGYGVGYGRGEEVEATARSFTDEFKGGAARLVLDEGKSITQAARDLDLTVSARRRPTTRSGSSAARSRSRVLAITLGAGARLPRALKMTCGSRC
jgi:transposase-like protein